MARAHILLSQGDAAAAVEKWALLPEGHALKFQGATLSACLDGELPPSEKRAFLDALDLLPDPEVQYYSSRILAYCGDLEGALTIVRRAIADDFCSTDGLANEVVWDPYRDRTEFQEVQRLAEACRERFREVAGL